MKSWTVLVNLYIDFLKLPDYSYFSPSPDRQHELFKEVMGKYPPPLPLVMADDVPGETKACLDLGCGSGSWSVRQP